MKNYINKIINNGDESGNEMVVKFRLPSGLEIFSLPTKNSYGGNWDLGPTWNYLVMADKPFLVDSGRFGQGRTLINMMLSTGIKPKDLKFVVISHGHEDHDGGISAILDSANLKLKAHRIYDLLIRAYPDKAPPGIKQAFPAKCWNCPMPETFYTKNCLEYHKAIQRVKVERINDDIEELGRDIKTYHLPGHSPDCLAIMLDSEAIIVGDIVLPGISPWPTRESLFVKVECVIRPYYDDPEAIFGLNRYIKSLKKLYEIALGNPEISVIPAHRLFYNGQWNGIILADRVKELIQHHIERCADIIEILRDGPMTAEEIAQKHFAENLLRGHGSMMAENEIVSHCELLIKNGDLIAIENDKYAATGKSSFEKSIALSIPMKDQEKGKARR